MTSKYKLILAHSVRPGVGTAELHNHWRGLRYSLVQELQPSLGYDDYAQLHQVSRLDPLYLSLLFSRSHFVRSLLTLGRLNKQRARNAALAEERWDVTDEFHYPSREALLASILSK